MIPIENFFSQGEMFRILHRQLQTGRVNHAILITGEAGLGKWTLANTVAAGLLCEASGEQDKPCGVCKSCIEMESLSHPDLIVIQKGKPLGQTESKSVIPVDDIREMIQIISRKSFQGDRRTVIIRHAEDMNDAAQNKLLKTLEDPPAGVFFLLTSINSDKLLPTIISRCWTVKLHPWSDERVLGFLSEHGITGTKAEETVMEAGGSFGKALAVANDAEYWELRASVLHDFLFTGSRSDIYTVSSRWKDRKEDADAVFSILEHVISRFSRRSLGISDSMFTSEEYPTEWNAFAERAQASDYVKLLEAVLLARKRMYYAVSFQAVVEQLIFSLMEAVRS